jgi:predicted DNA-binding transcriptional regulator YafY
MLTDEEALAVLLGLVTGPAMMPAGATESAAAKVRRVLPKPLAARLEALFATTEFTAPPSGGAALSGADRGVVPEAAVMLRLAEAARLRRPVLISYLDRAGRRSGRTLHPYGLVAHAGRWYATGADSASGEVRTFRLDRIEQAQIIHGTFTVPDGFASADAVLTSLAGTPWRHQVVVAVRGTAEEVRARLPQGIATVAPDAGGDPGWVLVRLRAERLDWLPALLAGLGLPFAVQEPAQLRDVVRTWADRIAGCAAATAPPEAARAWERGG